MTPFIVFCLIVASIFIALYVYDKKTAIIYAAFDFKEKVLTICQRNGKVIQYYGRCTVWYKLPNMERCGTPTESTLCDLWEFNKYHKRAFGKNNVTYDKDGMPIPR